jgi:NAD-dependent dihydropyrimidine dehydrogenase PreA subunit
MVRIDEERCDGCGWCVSVCAEGALRIIGGKACLISQSYCDGLGACLGGCPRDAITVEERESETFSGAAPASDNVTAPAYFAGWPSARIRDFDRPAVAATEITASLSALRHWPVQLALVPATAPFLRGADLLLTADCVPFAMSSFHERFLTGHVLVVACPKLDDYPSRLSKLTDIFRKGALKSVTVVRMEVPCCGGLFQMARQALEASGSPIPLSHVLVSTRGEVLPGA